MKTSTSAKVSTNYFTNIPIEGIIKIALFTALLILVVYPPYFRGLYFAQEQFFTEVFAFIVFTVFWLYKFIKRDAAFLKTPVECAALALTAIYFISIIFAVSKAEALNEWLKYCMYFSVFFMLSDLLTTYKSRMILICFLIASSLGVSILGLDSASGGKITKSVNGIFKLLGAKHDVFFDMFNGNRVMTSIQYPNAGAAFLAAVVFLLVGLMVHSKKHGICALYSGVGFVIFETFLLTLSRGAYIVFAISAIIYLIVLPWGDRIKAAIFILIIGTVSSGVFFRVIVDLGHMGARTFWKYIAAGIVLTMVASVVGSFLASLLVRINWKIYLIFAVIFLMGIGVGVKYLFSQNVPLTVDNLQSDKDHWISTTKSVILTPGKEYILYYDFLVTNTSSQPFALALHIFNKNISNVVTSEGQMLTQDVAKETSARTTKEIHFKVPEDSKVIELRFINYYKNTAYTLYHAKIVDAQTGKLTKNIYFKNKYIPSNLMDRFMGLASSQSTVARTIFYRDGFNLAKDHLVLGAGGGAWKSLYRAYQSYDYTSEESHNYFLQLLIEVGILGFIIFIILLFYIGLIMVKKVMHAKKEPEDNGTLNIRASAFAAIVMLGGHSIIDFDFSFPAVFLLFWTVVALFNSTISGNISNTAGKKAMKGIKKIFALAKLNLHPIAGVLIGLILVCLTGSIVYADYNAGLAVEQIAKERYFTASQYFKKASQYNPLETSYQIDYINTLRGSRKPSGSVLASLTKKVDSISRQSQYDMKVSNSVRDFYLTTGNIDKAMDVIDKQISLTPFNPVVWQNKAVSCFQIALQYFEKEDIQHASHYVEEGLKIIQDAKIINNKNIVPFKYNTATIQILQKLQYIYDHMDKDQSIDLSKIKFYNMKFMDIDVNGVPDQWEEIKAPSTIAISSNGQDIVINNKQADSIQKIGIKLMSLFKGKQYEIDLTLTNSIPVNEIPFNITDSIQGKLVRDGNSNTYRAVFDVQDDILSSDIVLYLGVQGEYRIANLSVAEL